MTARLPESFIQDLLSRVDIIDIIRARIALVKRGKNHLALCPFHSEKTPSFNVSQEKQFYYCFGCGTSGNVIGFLIAYDRLEFREAIQYLAAQAGVELPQDVFHHQSATLNSEYQLLEKISRFYQRELRHHQPAINYLKSRGLTGQTAKYFGIGYVPKQWDYLTKKLGHDKNTLNGLNNTGMLVKKTTHKTYDRFRDRIMFPIRDTRGRIIGFGGRTLGNDQPKYLNSPETPLFHKSSELYGLYEARQKNANLSQLIVVEGYLDVISLSQAGISQVVATLGTAVNPKHLQKLLRYSSQVVFCFDGDPAGRQAAWKALTISLPLLRDGIEVRFLFLPDQQDPDSIVTQQGSEVFLQLLNKASSAADFLFDGLAKDIDIQSIAGKAQYARQAIELLNTMPTGIYQKLLYDQLAERLNIPVKNLVKLTEPEPAPAPPRPAARRNLSPAEFATALLLHYPGLAATLNLEQVEALAHDESLTVFFKVLHILQHKPLTAGQLLVGLDADKDRQTISQLAAHPIVLSESAAQAELFGALERLKQQNRDYSIQKLIEKAKKTSLSEEEKRILQALLIEQNSHR